MPPATNQAAILVVDSSERVRKLVTGTLRTFGYLVFEYATGDDALTFVRDYAGPLALLLTIDVGGSYTDFELCAALRLMRPQLAVLHISSLARDSVTAAADVATALAFSLGPP